MKLKEKARFLKEAEDLLNNLFGEAIDKKQMSVGIYDLETDKALWDDEPKKDRNWSDPSVVHE